jgi:undecaprenyl-diphosphatase
MVIALHLGTTLSLFIVMRKEVLAVWHSFVSWLGLTGLSSASQDSVLGPAIKSAKLVKLLVISCASTTVPLLILAIFRWLLPYDPTQNLFEAPQFTAMMLIVNGMLLIVARRLSDKGHRSIADIDKKDALVIGLAQVLGVIPGVSRLGTTLLAAFWCRMTWHDSITYSFLLSIPIVLLGAIEELVRGNAGALIGKSLWQQWATGALVAGVVGLAAASFLRGRIGKKSLPWLAIWCWLVGTGTIVMWITTGFGQ